MGSGASSIEGDVAKLKKITLFTPKQLRAIHNQYTLTNDGETSGAIKGADEVDVRKFINSLPRNGMNPLFHRALSIYVETNDVLTFESFTRLLAIFSYNGSLIDKTKLAFQLFDEGGDGYLSPEELRTMFSLTIGATVLSHAQVSGLINQILKESSNTDKRKGIPYEQFTKLVSPSELRLRMTYDYFSAISNG